MVYKNTGHSSSMAVCMCKLTWNYGVHVRNLVIKYSDGCAHISVKSSYFNAIPFFDGSNFFDTEQTYHFILLSYLLTYEL